MTNTEILSKHLEYIFYIDKSKIKNTYCKICGIKKECIKEKEAISSNFTNHDLCKCKDSLYICIDCTKCLKDVELRRNNFIADKNNLYLFKKNDIEEYVFNIDKYIKDDFIVGITYTFKKHNSFKCNINSNFEKFYIQQEDDKILFDLNKAKYIYDILNDAYLYFTKDELLTGEYKTISVYQYTLTSFDLLEKTIKDIRKTNLFKFLIYILNSEKRNEILQERRNKSG